MAEGTGCPSPWNPETSQHRLAVLGKLAEEGSEVATAAVRCIIQGIDECEPVTGKSNREWLEDEIADIMAQCNLAVTALGLSHGRIVQRVKRKMDYTGSWQETLRGK
jgi:hypothetical protein